MGNKIIENMDPKQSFFFGLIQGDLVLAAIGFVVMLFIHFGGNSTKTSGRAPAAQVEQPANPSPSQPTPSVNVPGVSDDDHLRGNRDPKVTIIEYSDFECKFCGRFHETMEQVIGKFDGSVAWVYRHFPLESIHSNARPAANAAECAGEQGMFWEFADELFTAQSSGLSNEVYTRIASDIGLNGSRFAECVASNKYNDVVTADSQAVQAAGGRGTPYSVIVGPDGQMVPLSGAQPLSAVEAAIGQFLN